jgi:FlaA1/EpsC-like NDP-sugar epimerase
MDQTVNPWKANLTNGVILALLGIVYTLVIYFLDLSFNKMQGWIFLVVQIIVLFFLVKSYRDNYRYGMITYGQALGAGVIIFFYYAIIMAVFTYLLYAVIDPDLVDKQLAFAEEEMIKRGIPESAIEAGMKLQTKIMKPAIMAPLSIFGSMFQGLIMSLIVAAFVKKEGNPLLDPTEKIN